MNCNKASTQCASKQLPASNLFICYRRTKVLDSLFNGGVIGVIYIAFTSTIVQQLGVLTFTLFSVGGQLVGSLIIDLVSPTDGVSVSVYLVTGIVMTYAGVIAGGVGSSRVKKPQKL